MTMGQRLQHRREGCCNGLTKTLQQKLTDGGLKKQRAKK